MSGRKFSYEVTTSSSASAATLFRIVADGANYSQWAKPIIMQSSWVREGDPTPWGIGAIRKVGAWPLFGFEETVRYEQDHCFAYKLNEPAPVEN
jgi:Polyketide cyclase / dehydrase and lipid transport